MNNNLVFSGLSGGKFYNCSKEKYSTSSSSPVSDAMLLKSSSSRNSESVPDLPMAAVSVCVHKITVVTSPLKPLNTSLKPHSLKRRRMSSPFKGEMQLSREVKGKIERETREEVLRSFFESYSGVIPEIGEFYRTRKVSLLESGCTIEDSRMEKLTAFAQDSSLGLDRYLLSKFRSFRLDSGQTFSFHIQKWNDVSYFKLNEKEVLLLKNISAKNFSLIKEYINYPELFSIEQWNHLPLEDYLEILFFAQEYQFHQLLRLFEDVHPLRFLFCCASVGNRKAREGVFRFLQKENSEKSFWHEQMFFEFKKTKKMAILERDHLDLTQFVGLYLLAVEREDEEMESYLLHFPKADFPSKRMCFALYMAFCYPVLRSWERVGLLGAVNSLLPPSWKVKEEMGELTLVIEGFEDLRDHAVLEKLQNIFTLRYSGGARPRLKLKIDIKERIVDVVGKKRACAFFDQVGPQVSEMIFENTIRFRGETSVLELAYLMPNLRYVAFDSGYFDHERNHFLNNPKIMELISLSRELNLEKVRFVRCPAVSGETLSDLAQIKADCLEFDECRGLRAEHFNSLTTRPLCHEIDLSNSRVYKITELESFTRRYPHVGVWTVLSGFAPGKREFDVRKRSDF